MRDQDSPRRRNFANLGPLECRGFCYDADMAQRNRKLLVWYRRARRQLPWREAPTPYNTWVAELMLQQTQVLTVVPYFERFVARFPDVDALADATEEQVLALWSGLGYYRRARALREGARRIVADRGGRFPEDVDGWMALPGIGRYTAGAIVSIALGKRAPILDGNVMRVLTRWFAISGDPRRGATNTTLWRLAEEILPSRSVAEYNQALMELGALICLPRQPRCSLCPVRSDCIAHERGLVDVLPELSVRPASVQVAMAAAVVRERGRFLMFQRKREELMKDLWEFPGGECRAGETPESAIVREARERYGLGLRRLDAIATVRHNVMNRRIELHAFAAARLGSPPFDAPHRWVRREDLGGIPVSSVVPKILNAMTR